MPAFDKAILSAVDRAVQRYGMIEKGDRVLVAASGGKDSTTLTWALSRLRSREGADFELSSVHISSEFDECKTAELKDLFDEWGVPYAEVKVAVLERLKPGRKMNCYWCSTQRRTELLRYAMEKGYTKIALGHHLDDILETFLMNMTLKGELSTMPARLDYAKYPVSIIRPLALVEERQIIGFSQSAGFSKVTCSCPYGANSKRRDLRLKLALISGGSPSVKRRIFDSLSNVKADYLSGLVKRGEDADD